MENVPEFKNPVSKETAKMLNPQVLAYVGDGVHSLYVRTRLALSSDAKAGVLHKIAAVEVSAVHQSDMAGMLLGVLTDEETDIFKRARNGQVGAAAKNAKISDYKRATGLEAVLGYLYMTGQSERLLEILNLTEQK